MSFVQLAQDIQGEGADSVFLLMSAVDCALFCQHLRKIDPEGNIRIFSFEWSITRELLKLGGPALDGLLVLQTVDLSAEETTMQAFKKRYLQRFGREPDFAACHGYDAVRLLAHAIANASDRHDVRRALLASSQIESFHGKVSLDEYGDVVRPLFPTVIMGGKAVRFGPEGFNQVKMQRPER